MEISLAAFVSNEDKNIYTISNLPEEVIAVIFAYVSRSPLSFRENLRKLLKSNDLDLTKYTTNNSTLFSKKASEFHEKWVVKYGHNSVAEHAIAHVGIEKISRLASAELELATTFNSFTEYSQRYQRPCKNNFYTPKILTNELREEYYHFQQKAFEVYEKIHNKLMKFLSLNENKKEGETEKSFLKRIEKISFENARYVLTLATFTNLGLTGNARSLRDTIVTMLSSQNDECREIGLQMKEEISKSIPTLLKYAQESSYLIKTKNILKEKFNKFKQEKITSSSTKINFLNLPDYIESLKFLVTLLFITTKNISYEKASELVKNFPKEKLEKIIEEALEKLPFFENPLTELLHLTYTWEMKISEANWHQLLRHNRKTSFTYSRPTTTFGYITPPLIKCANITTLFSSFMEEADKLYKKIYNFNERVAEYVVTNSHLRQIVCTASLWELYHLINLRTTKEAQWDIRDTFNDILKFLEKEHPILIKYAKRRSKN